MATLKQLEAKEVSLTGKLTKIRERKTTLKAEEEGCLAERNTIRAEIKAAKAAQPANGGGKGKKAMTQTTIEDAKHEEGE